MPDRPSPSTMPSAANPLRKPVSTLVITRSLDLVGMTFWVPLDLVVDDVVLDRQSMKDCTDACSTQQTPLLAPQPQPAAATQRPHPRPADLRGLTNRLIYFVAVAVVTMSSLARRLWFPLDFVVEVVVLESSTMKDCTNANATLAALRRCQRRCGAAASASGGEVFASTMVPGGFESRGDCEEQQHQQALRQEAAALVDAYRQASRQEAERRRILLERIDAAADREAAMEAEFGGREGSPGPRPGRAPAASASGCPAAGLPPSPAATGTPFRGLWAGGGIVACPPPRPTAPAASASGNAAPAAATFKEPPTIEGPPPIKAPPRKRR